MSKPAFRVYTVIKRDGTKTDSLPKEDFWLNIGIAFAHEDHQGFNILLQALPIDGKLVLRTYRDEDEEKPKAKPSYKR